MSGMTLGEYAKTLDEHALSLAEMDDYKGAKLAIEVAEAFERRQQQLDAKDFVVDAEIACGACDEVRQWIDLQNNLNPLGMISVRRVYEDISGLVGES